jgi:oligopeptide transport system substrate-binding protein
MRATGIGILSVCLTLLFGACSPGKPRADLVFLNGAEPETLDPALITGQPEGRIANALFEGLTTFNEFGEAVPGVAERWEISPDGKLYRFHLRRNAKWSNNTLVTAHDFVRSWQRTLHPETPSEYAYQLHYIRNGRAYNEGTLKDFAQVGVRALDDFTLEVELENPTPFFLDLCAFVTLLPVHVPTVEKFGDNWIKPENMVNNGAYLLDDWRLNDRVSLKKNPYYWDADSVAMETIDILPTSRANTAFNIYASGGADLMMDKGLVPISLIGELRKRRDYHSAPFLGTCFIRFNVTQPPFDDPRVRRAISLAMDRVNLVEKILRAGEDPAYGLVPPGAGGYKVEPHVQRNTDLARKLLAEAGYPGGSGFPRFTYLYNEGEINEAIAVEIQSVLQNELGIQMTPARQEWKVYLRSMSNLDFSMCRSSWVGDYNDPNTFMDLFVTGGGNNRTGWGNPRYDELIAAAAKEPSNEKRFALFEEAERLLVAEEAPIVPLYYYVGIQFYDRERLGGIEANLLDEHPLRRMRWKK